jgi:hypothetical protein
MEQRLANILEKAQIALREAQMVTEHLDIPKLFKYQQEAEFLAAESEALKKRVSELEQKLTDATSCNDNCTAKVKELKNDLADAKQHIENQNSFIKDLTEKDNKSVSALAIRLVELNNKVEKLKAHHKTLLAEKESYSQKQLDELIVENAKLKQHAKNVAA